MDVPNLHDATLLGLSLQWGKKAELTARFRSHGHRILTLKVLDVTLLHCSHDNPWGPSVSVNEVRSIAGPRAGLHRIEIELQSGDTMVVEGDGIEWATETNPVG
jgi:hypothetical protein